MDSNLHRILTKPLDDVTEFDLSVITHRIEEIVELASIYGPDMFRTEMEIIMAHADKGLEHFSESEPEKPKFKIVGDDEIKQ